MKRRAVLGRLALSVVATALALGAAELTLRVLSIGDPVLRDAHPVLGWAPIPGAEGTWTREGRAHVRITEHGFRGIEVAPGPPPEGTLRIAVVGDSYTEAKQVELDQRFTVHAEAALNACRGSSEVLTFGVAGYGTAQEYRLLHHRVRAWEPDVVLVALLTGNDIADNHAALRTSGEPAPYFTLEDGHLRLDDSFLRSERYQARVRGGAWRWLKRHFRLARLLAHVGQPARRRDVASELGLHPEIYAPPATDAWRDAWARTEALLAQMHREETRRGARFGVVTLSNATQVAPDPGARAAYAEQLGVPDLRYPDRRIAEAGQRDGYRVLTLVDPLADWAEANDTHLHGFENTAMDTGHWNATGHRVAGEELGRWLCGWLADGRTMNP